MRTAASAELRAAAQRVGGPRCVCFRHAGPSAPVTTEDTRMDNARVQQLARQQDRVVELRGYL